MARKKNSDGIGLVRTLNLLAFLPIAGRAPLYGRLLWALATDPRVPTSRKVVLGLAAAYVVSPVDLIPERVPVIGRLDDVAVVVLAVDVFLSGLPSGLVKEKLDELGIPEGELEADLRRIRSVVPKPVRKAAERIPDAIEGVFEFARQRGLDDRLRGLMAAPVGGEGATARRSGAESTNTVEGSPA